MNESRITTAIGLLTVIATLIAAIPGFKQLALERAHVYYDVSALSILNPNSPDLPRVRTVLRANNVPDSTVAIRIKNTGEGPAKEVRLGVTVAGEITDVEFVPPLNERPVWVDLPPAASIVANRATTEFRNFAPGRILNATARYYSLQPGQAATVDVYFDGKPAQATPDITLAPRHTALSEFMLPLKILGGGVALMVLAAIVIVLVRIKKVSEEVRASLPYPLNLF